MRGALDLAAANLALSKRTFLRAKLLMPQKITCLSAEYLHAHFRASRQRHPSTTAATLQNHDDESDDAADNSLCVSVCVCVQMRNENTGLSNSSGVWSLGFWCSR